MSRSKTGMDQERRNEQSQPDDQPQSAGLEGQRGYENQPTGRESWREFPRRSSLSGRRSDINYRSEDERRNRGDLPQSEAYGRRSSGGLRNSMSEDYRNTASGRGWSQQTVEDYGRDDPRYGKGGDEGRDRWRESHREEGFGRHSYDDLASGRADHEDIPRYRRGGRAYQYDRDDYRAERRDYDEPYNRQATGGRYDAESDYSTTAYDRYSGVGYGYGGDYGWGRDIRGEERGWGRGRSVLRCGEIMTKNVTTCGPNTVVRDVADLMEGEKVGSIPVLDNGRLVGIITDRDIVCRVVAEGRDTRATKAGEVMSQEIITCTSDDSVIDAIRKMGEHQVRRIPICDLNGRLRGIIALGDIALEAERDQDLANALEQISQPTPHQSRRI